jgi:hypothetical protein
MNPINPTNSTKQITAALQHYNYFLNLLLANTPIPINPEPRRNIVAGSGTAVGVILGSDKAVPYRKLTLEILVEGSNPVGSPLRVKTTEFWMSAYLPVTLLIIITRRWIIAC